ncbi:MAG: M48 family metallopeptidase [Xanthobacteraceae bacterium]|nr:M48 family metallopeptidase [Xanthobacteraceae bacterium]
MSTELATKGPLRSATAAPAVAEVREPAHPAVYFDGRTNRKRSVKLSFTGGVDIIEQDTILDVWSFGDVRRADGPPNVMRLSCVAALPLARLEISDPATQTLVAEHCKALDAAGLGQVRTGKIVLWSLAAVCSIVGLAWFGIPHVADRLAPYVPMAFEKRIGEMADGQIRGLLGGKECTGAAGQAAFRELVEKLRTAGNLEIPLDAHVLSSGMANAFALPGGRIYLLDGLLQKARSPDEIAGILAHELGHVRHRDSMRQMIQTGGTSFLFGLLFGDVSGAGAVIFISRSMLDASYSRDAERGADAFAIDTMQRLGRSPVPAGALLFRVTGAQANKSISILSSHPLTEERLETMKKADRTPIGPELLTAAQWTALKDICK